MNVRFTFWKGALRGWNALTSHGRYSPAAAAERLRAKPYQGAPRGMGVITRVHKGLFVRALRARKEQS